MPDLTDAEIEAALERGRIAQQTEPRAASTRYDGKSGRIIVELTNGCTFAFPPRMAQGLETATDDELAAVEIMGAGYGLHWEALDADLSVPGLLAGRFGTKAYMARRAEQATSPAKAATARASRHDSGMKHSDFAIGREFLTATGTWRCTDIGARTIIAIKVSGRSDAAWFSGPPYAVAETVFDAQDWEGCWPNDAAQTQP